MVAGKSYRESEYFKTIEDVSSDERIMCIVHQHPFGIIFVYILSFVCLTFALLGISIMLPSFGGTAINYGTIALVSLLAAFLIGRQEDDKLALDKKEKQAHEQKSHLPTDNFPFIPAATPQ